MNLDSARNRVQIISGLATRIERYAEGLEIARACSSYVSSSILSDAEVIVRQCQLLALDLEEPHAVNKDTGTLSGNRRE